MMRTTHKAFEGSPTAYHRLRAAVCEAAGGDYWMPCHLPHKDPVKHPNPGWWYVPDDCTRERFPGLYLFLGSDDQNVKFSPAELVLIIRDLEPLLPILAKRTDASGHIEADGGYGPCLGRFLDGCRRAVKRNQSLRL